MPNPAQKRAASELKGLGPNGTYLGRTHYIFMLLLKKCRLGDRASQSVENTAEFVA